MTVRTAQTAKTSHRGSERPAWGRHRVQKDFLSGGSKGDRLHRSSHLGNTGDLERGRDQNGPCQNQRMKRVYRHLVSPVRKKCIFSRKKFVQPVRSVLVRTCTANLRKLKRIIVYISDFRTSYEPYRLFEVRTQFFQMRTEQSSSHCANLIVALPQEAFPLGESSKSPLHFAAHRDESVIVGYYTSEEVHLRSPSPFDEP